MADGNVKIETVTTAEAAFVVGLPQRHVQKQIDAGPIKPRKVRGRRMLDRPDLVYLAATKDLAGRLKPEAREAFYAQVKRSRLDPHQLAAQVAAYTIALGRDVTCYVLTVDEGLARLRMVQQMIDENAENGPAIRGTRIEAHRIAALLDGGATLEMVLEDYPSLKRSQVEAARDYATAHPKAGRPYPTRSFKRAFDGAGLDDLADVLDDAVAKRRRAAR